MPEDALSVRQSLDLFKAMGFGISDFGGDSFMVDAMPACLGNAAPSAVFVDIARSLDRGGARGGTERWAEERVAMAACKAAVKANDKLSVQEIEQLVLDLASAEMPYTCPHGRPTIIFTSFAELEKKFGRVQ
jgi:DNA mismatch repair protein MutL